MSQRAVFCSKCGKRQFVSENRTNVFCGYCGNHISIPRINTAQNINIINNTKNIIHEQKTKGGIPERCNRCNGTLHYYGDMTFAVCDYCGQVYRDETTILSSKDEAKVQTEKIKSDTKKFEIEAKEREYIRKEKAEQKEIKIALIILIVLILFLIIMPIYFITREKTTPKEGQIKMDYGSNSLIGMNCDEVKRKLRDIGFSYVEIISAGYIADSEKENTVKSVNIDGMSSFNKGKIFDKNVMVKVYVYTSEYREGAIINNNEINIQLDFSSSDCIGQNYTDIINRFESLGFINIEKESTKKPLFSSVSKNDVKSVSINGNLEFKAGETYSKDAAINIIYYK